MPGGPTGFHARFEYRETMDNHTRGCRIEKSPERSRQAVVLVTPSQDADFRAIQLNGDDGIQSEREIPLPWVKSTGREW